MPGLITHYLGGQAALAAVSQEIRDYILPVERLFNIGTQGPDIFFYYIPGFFTKRIRGIGSTMHNENLGLFFLYLAEILIASNGDTGMSAASADALEDTIPSKETAQNNFNDFSRQALFAIMTGYLVHYAMDVHTHSYVYAKTHDPNISTLQESAAHRHFETSVDVLMYKRAGHRPNDVTLRELIRPDKLHIAEVSKVLSAAIRKIYDVEITKKDVHKAMNHMANLTMALQSKNGRRKRWLENAERMTIGPRIVSALIHMQEVTDGYDYLNLENTPWSAPWESQEIRTESFITLYDAAVSDAIEMIEALYAYMYNHIQRCHLEKKIMNRSLKTGKNNGDSCFNTLDLKPQQEKTS